MSEAPVVGSGPPVLEMSKRAEDKVQESVPAGGYVTLGQVKAPDTKKVSVVDPSGKSDADPVHPPHVAKAINAFQRLKRANKLRLPSLRTQEDDDELGLYLPHADLHLRSMELEKLCADDEWKIRQVIMTERSLFLANVGESKMTDSIPLHEMTAVQADKRPVSRSVSDAELGDKQKKKARSPTQSFRRPSLSFDGGEKGVNHHHHLPQKGRETYMFEIHTDPTGHNSGRTYYFRTHDEIERDMWVSHLWKQAKKAKRVEKNLSRFRRLQEMIRKMHSSAFSQGFVACLIVGNFIVSAAESQINPLPGDASYESFKNIDLAFTLVFAAEVGLNMFGNGRRFADDGWNWFDLLVVLISLVALTVTDVSSIKTLRLMRAFRLVRIVKRLSSLRRLINAITASIAPVVNAMIIVLLVICIYAVMGVNSFQDTNEIQFGTFDKALFTMFATSTLDGWNLAARSMFGPDGGLDIGVVLFYVTFIVMVSWTLLPVVVAVLLESFTLATRKEKEMKEAQRFQTNKGPTAAHPLDPLLSVLFQTDNDADFRRRALQLFEVLDADASGKLTYRELVEGLKKIPKFSSIHLSREDFERLAVERQLVDEDKSMTSEQFELLMRIEVREFVYRQIGIATAISDTEDPTLSMVLSGIKTCLLGIDELTDRMHGLEVAHRAGGAGSPKGRLSPSGSNAGRVSRSGSNESARAPSGGSFSNEKHLTKTLNPTNPAKSDTTTILKYMHEMLHRMSELEHQNKQLSASQRALERRLAGQTNSEEAQRSPILFGAQTPPAASAPKLNGLKRNLSRSDSEHSELTEEQIEHIKELMSGIPHDSEDRNKLMQVPAQESVDVAKPIDPILSPGHNMRMRPDPSVQKESSFEHLSDLAKVESSTPPTNNWESLLANLNVAETLRKHEQEQDSSLPEVAPPWLKPAADASDVRPVGDASAHMEKTDDIASQKVEPDNAAAAGGDEEAANLNVNSNEVRPELVPRPAELDSSTALPMATDQLHRKKHYQMTGYA